MSGATTGEGGGVNLITTELDFFGGIGEGSYFGYPQGYHEAMAAAEVQGAAAATVLQSEMDTKLAETAADDQEQVRQGYERAMTLTVSDARRQVDHSWYEGRFRSNFVGNGVDDRHPDVADYLESLRPNHPLDSPVPCPTSEAIAAYFNDAITENQWSGALTYAQRWYEDLDETDPTRATAAEYIGFTGSLILQEYCRLAVGLADDSLADDTFVSSKHLVTVCWPTANRLEAFIPDQVRVAKQLLREVFLQAATRGGGFRRDLMSLGYLCIDEQQAHGIEERIAQEERSLREVMRFDIDQEADKQRLINQAVAAADTLASEQRWFRAIDLLDLARYAFDAFTDDMQARIDALALAGADYYTRDMNQYRVPRLQNAKHDIWSNHGELYANLEMAPGLSEGVPARMANMKSRRELEHKLQQRNQQAASPDADPDELRALDMNLFITLTRADEAVAKQLAAPELIESLIEIFGSLGPGTSPITYDNFVTGIIRLTNYGVFTPEQQNEMLVAMTDNLCEHGRNGLQQGEWFHEQFMGLISPIMRGTKETAEPEDEVVWQFVSREQFIAAMDAEMAKALANDYASLVTWAFELKSMLLTDIRAGWGHYWDIVEEY